MIGGYKPEKEELNQTTLHADRGSELKKCMQNR